LNEKALPHVAPLAAQISAPLKICDIEKPGDLETFVTAAAEHLGGIDFAIHSIAFAPLNDLHGRVVDSSPDGFSRAMRISCHSFAEMARLVEPHMPQGGSLLTMSYLGAEAAVPHYGIMGPVKAALESTVRYLALELGPKNIRVNAISPGPVPTRAASGIEAFDELMTKAAQEAPLGRIVTIDEVGETAAFLAGHASSGITGQVLFVDAGVHAVRR
jgi:enoyl-[acyl-carrier protein] reductase I